LTIGQNKKKILVLRPFQEAFKCSILIAGTQVMLRKAYFLRRESWLRLKSRTPRPFVIFEINGEILKKNYFPPLFGVVGLNYFRKNLISVPNCKFMKFSLGAKLLKIYCQLDKDCNWFSFHHNEIGMLDILKLNNVLDDIPRPFVMSTPFQTLKA
jgi:hypothetical protein